METVARYGGDTQELFPPVPPKPSSHVRSRSETRASETEGSQIRPPVPVRTSSINNSDVMSRLPVQLAVSDNIMAPEPFFGQKEDDGVHLKIHLKITALIND